MLKKRLIPIQLLIDGRLVKTVQFGSYRDVGDPVKSAKVYNDQNADELVFLNINRSRRDIEDLKRVIDAVADVSFMPLAVGGGIRTLSDAEYLITNGADKIIVNSICYRSASLVGEIGRLFGNQAVVVGIDCRLEDGIYRCYSDCGRKREDVDLLDYVQQLEDAGAGEIIITSIDRDGTMTGYDHTLISLVCNAVSIPVIGAGGSSNYDDLRDAFLDTDCSALACGSIFNFGDNNPIRAKAALTNAGLKFKKV